MDSIRLPEAELPSSQVEEAGQESGVYVFPASLEQIRYWTLDQLDGASTASNMAIAARLEGVVEDGLAERAVRSLVERHEALRTTFRLVDDRLCQVISEEATYNFAVTDLSRLPETEREAAAAAAIEEHSHARATLAAGPAFFVRLIHLSDRLHYIAFTMHHIVCDGWSNGILIRDFTDFYAAFAQGISPVVPELPFQFADFTVWQQNWLESEAAQAALAYWRTNIARGLPAVDLPTDSPRLPQKSYPGHIESTLLSPDLTARLKAYCRSHNATMHQVMLAAFQALIARYTSQHEFLLGSTIANRTQPGMENVVGRFANPQVILADVNGDPTYAELLERVADWSAESYAHQDLPFSRLMEEFQLDQAGATSQFLQVYFVYQKAFMQPQEARGLKVTPRPSVSGGVNFDLLVSIVERAEGPRLQMEYNTVCFRKERIANLIAMYVRVLEAVMQDDAIRVSNLPLAESVEQNFASTAGSTAPALPASMGNAAAEPPLETTAVSIAQWLDQRAESLGEAPAIVLAQGGQSVSWNTLRALSLTLATSLIKRGLAAGQVIALRIEPSVESVAAAWALLRIGAVVFPLPASSSAAEWASVLGAHKPAMAFASAAFARTIPGVDSLEDLSADTAGAGQVFNPLSPSAPAWVGFADASTAALSVSSHEATLHQLRSLAATLGLGSDDVVLAYPAQSAVDAWMDLLLPLTAGATLLLAGSSTPNALQPLLDSHQASFLMASPQVLLAAVHARWHGDRRLNVVVRGGILNSAQQRRLSTVPMRLWAILSSPACGGPFAAAKAGHEETSAYLPLTGSRLVILDENGHPAPAGATGELAVQTENAMARTGYLARTSSSSTMTGAVEILDRAGRLVRLHGYRLRLGEPEEFLWQSPAVADAAAALVANGDATTLVVYFQAFTPLENDARTARDHFRAVAPGHVATAELIQVERIPRNADGSVDLSLLPAPGATQKPAAPSDEYVAPRDELESKLVAVWEDVLGVRPVGIRTSFFKLGGYSLMIVRLFARINKVLGSSLPITTIFNAPTVEQLADIVRGRAYYSTLVPVQTRGTRPPFFMIHSYLLYQGIPAELGDDFPFYGLRELDTDASDMTVEQRAAACVDAMRSVQPQGPYYIGGWCAAGPLAVETARQLVASGNKVGYLVLFDSWRPGYAAELAVEQAGKPENSLGARLDRKFRFHRSQWQPLSAWQRVRYAGRVIGNKITAVKSQAYLKNWAFAERFCNYFGLPMPHFMHNVSLTTLNSLKEYRGTEQYPGTLTLVRAKEAPYIPGALEHCGWNAIVRGDIHVLWAPGNHETMFLPPHLQQVGEFLRQGLSDAYAEQHVISAKAS